jgi:hypothetical protein
LVFTAYIQDAKRQRGFIALSDKTIKTLIIALVALVAVYGIFRLVENKNLKPIKPSGFNLPALKESTIDKISVKNSQDAYEIVKTNNKWQIGKKEVDPSNMTQLWQALKAADVGSLATSNKSEFSLFQVDDTQGKTVKFYENNNEKAAFIFGKQTSDFVNGYIRKLTSNEVYVVSGELGTLFAKTKKDWYPPKKGNE